jgi:hypothetical protein
LQPGDDIVGFAEMVGEHGDVGLARDTGPIRKLQRDILVVIEYRYLHGTPVLIMPAGCP